LTLAHPNRMASRSDLFAIHRIIPKSSLFRHEVTFADF
jgi:hypothetical protein